MKASEMFDLTGRVALVTGASSGLGVRFAEVLAENGARVVLVARRADRLDALKKKIEAAGGQAAVAEADVLDRRIVTIPAKDWERFEAWAAAPARDVAGLKELAGRPPTWRK